MRQPPSKLSHTDERASDEQVAKAPSKTTGDNIGYQTKEYIAQRTALEEGRVKAWYQHHQEHKHDKQ